MKQRGFTLILILIIGLLIIGGYFIFKTKSLTKTLTANKIQTSVISHAPISTSAPAIQSEVRKITSCDSIRETGRYTLDEDLHVTGNGCLDIQNINDVHIDCKGHSIILDQQNKPNTEAIKPLLGFKNVKNFSVESCTFKVVNPSFTPPNIAINNSSDGVISNSTFYDPNIVSDGLDAFFILFDHTDRVKITGNTIYGVYQHHYSNNIVIENNSILPTLKTLKQISGPIAMDHGSHNIIRDNILDGKWDGIDKNQKVGADDGIEFTDESYNTIQNNKIKNNWDCGIETTGLIENTTISGNTITNSGVCGIGAWYYNSWKGNLVEGNTIDSAPRFFLFFRTNGLRHQEEFVYFSDNTFRTNTFLNPMEDVSSTFSFHGVQSGGQEAERNVTDQSYIIKNNQFTGNDFNSKVRAPGFFPSSGATDGGNNKCGEPALGDYPNVADFPLKCISR